MEAEESSRRWESEAKEFIERAIRAETKRDATRLEASMSRLDAEAARSIRALVESELARVQHALATSEDARQQGECSTLFWSDPINESEPVLGCSFNSFYLFVFFFQKCRDPESSARP